MYDSFLVLLRHIVNNMFAQKLSIWFLDFPYTML
jgi:hypothetical protein